LSQTVQPQRSHYCAARVGLAWRLGHRAGLLARPGRFIVARAAEHIARAPRNARAQQQVSVRLEGVEFFIGIFFFPLNNTFPDGIPACSNAAVPTAPAAPRVCDSCEVSTAKYRAAPCGHMLCAVCSRRHGTRVRSPSSTPGGGKARGHHRHSHGHGHGHSHEKSMPASGPVERCPRCTLRVTSLTS
jgi:hypothetical protein